MLVSMEGDDTVAGKLPLGLAAVMGGCTCSALASVYTEIVIKSNSTTIWECNLLLSLWGIFFGLAAISGKELDAAISVGSLRGFTPIVWVMVLIQSLGGLV